MFVTLPKVFDSMSLGAFVGAAFFLLVLFAALTSAISLMETVVSIVQDKLKWGRVKSSILVFFGALVVGVPSSLGFGVWSGFQPIKGMTILDFFDFLSNSVLMPIVALLTCIFVAYVVKTKVISDEVALTSPFKRKRMFEIIIRYIAPVCILAILISSVLNALGVMKI